MGKATLNTVIDEDAKGNIRDAARPVLGKKGSMIKLLEAVGFGLGAEMKRLGVKKEELGAYRLKVELERRESPVEVT